MLRTKLAKKVLTKKEQKHLTESGIRNMTAMQRQVDFSRGKHPMNICLDCRHIAVKLGMTVR